MAAKMPKAGRIEIQGDAYEGYIVWFNSLIQSAGGQILVVAGPRWRCRTGRRARRSTSCGKLATSKAADPSLPAQREDQARLAFETGDAAFQVNYPFIYPSARDNKAPIFKDIALGAVSARGRRHAVARRRSAASTGASARYTKHPRGGLRRGRVPAQRGATSATSRSRAGCRRRSRRSTTTRRSRRTTRSRDVIRDVARDRRGAPAHAASTPTCRWRSSRPLHPPSSVDAEGGGQTLRDKHRAGARGEGAAVSETTPTPRHRRRRLETKRKKHVERARAGRSAARLHARARPRRS